VLRPAEVFPFSLSIVITGDSNAASSAVAKFVAIGNEPAHGGCRADSNVAQGRYEVAARISGSDIGNP